MSTKTIRIPMIVDANGKWCAYGYSSLAADEEPDWDMMEDVADAVNHLVNPQRKWVTATVSLPETEEVRGEEELA